MIDKSKIPMRVKYYCEFSIIEDKGSKNYERRHTEQFDNIDDVFKAIRTLKDCDSVQITRVDCRYREVESHEGVERMSGIELGDVRAEVEDIKTNESSCQEISIMYCNHGWGNLFDSDKELPRAVLIETENIWIQLDYKELEHLIHLLEVARDVYFEEHPIEHEDMVGKEMEE